MQQMLHKEMQHKQRRLEDPDNQKLAGLLNAMTTSSRGLDNDVRHLSLNVLIYAAATGTPASKVKSQFSLIIKLLGLAGNHRGRNNLQVGGKLLI